LEDARIVELYWERDEAAIAESSAKYGGYCYQIAFRILALREDAEECVGDTWLRAWEAMPPSRPGRRGGKPVPVRAPVGRKARKHQPQAVQKLCAGAECAAYAGHAGPLVQRQSGGHIQHFVHLGLCGLRHAPARVGGERIQIPPRALGVHNAQRQR